MVRRLNGNGWWKPAVLCTIFLIALLIRMTVVYYLEAPPAKDALQYHTIAINQLQGYGHALEPGKPTSLRPPLYPLVLAALYALTGVDYRHALYAQAVAHALLVFPIFWLGSRISGRFWVGILSASVFGVHPSFESVSQLLRENLTTALVVLFLCSMYAALDKPDYKKFALAGVLAGMLALTNPVFVPLGVTCVLFCMLTKENRARYKMFLVPALISILIITPWIIRNKFIHENQQEQHLKLTVIYGYYPAFTGKWWWPVQNMTELEHERELARAFIAQHGDNKSLIEDLRSKIMTNPLGAVKLAFNRTVLLWASPPVGTSFLKSYSMTLADLVLYLNWIFVILGIGGLCWYCRKDKKLLVFVFMALYLTAVYAVTHSIRRYGFPLVPQLCLFFVLGIYALYLKYKGSG
jgi:hypothetical protein